MKALVFGATGTVGQVVVQELLKKNIGVHGLRRQKSEFKDGIQWLAHDFSQGPIPAAAWEGVSLLFLLSPSGYMQQDKFLLPVIQEAQKRKLQKVVLMTAMGVNHAVGSPLQKVESALQASGLAHAIIRPNWFSQNFHSYWGEGIRQQNSIFLAAGNAKVSLIDARDIGEVAVRLLTTDKQGAFDITGPEALTHAEVASILSEVLGRRIQYVDVEPEAFKQSLIKAGLAPDYAEFMLVIIGALRAGHSAVVTPHVEQILGKKPRNFAQYAQEHKALLSR